MKITIQTATEKDFLFICAQIKKLELDNRNLYKEQFKVATKVRHVIGFGRIKTHPSCSELCSLGVIEPERLKGVAKKIVRELIQLAEKPLYLVCIIPAFFESLGFRIVSEYPEEIREKLIYCTNELVVKERYVVMKHF